MPEYGTPEWDEWYQRQRNVERFWKVSHLRAVFHNRIEHGDKARVDIDADSARILFELVKTEQDRLHETLYGTRT